MSVYDCCSFFNENDIFEIRLNQHWDFVDKFIVVEAGETHTGLKKPLNFDHERFKPYADKIIYRSFDSFTQALEEFPEYYDQLNASLLDFKPEWIRDSYQNNYIFKVLTEIGAQDSDLVLYSPPDEIVKKEAFEQAAKVFADSNAVFDVIDNSRRVQVNGTRPIIYFCMKMYIYKFNLLSVESVPQPMLTEYGNYKKIFPSLARNVGIHTHPPIESAGWHFSYADNTNGERVLTKMKSWAHATDPGKGLNGGRRMDITTPLEAIQILVNEFNFKIEPMGPDTHPEYILNNLEKFKDYIFEE